EGGGAKNAIHKEGRMVRRGVINSSLALLLFCLIGRPGAAQQCPQFETLLTIAGVTGGTQNSPDQATLSAGGCVTLRVIVTRPSGSTITSTDVTTSPNTKFFTDPARGTFSGPNGSVFRVSTAECNRQFPVYVRYTDPCTGTTETDTVHITVLPCVTVISPAFG